MITVCCSPLTSMTNTVPTSVYIHNDRGYLKFEMTAFPTPHVTAMMYLGPVLTDGVKGEASRHTSSVLLPVRHVHHCRVTSPSVTYHKLLMASTRLFSRTHLASCLLYSQSGVTSSQGKYHRHLC